MSESAEILRVEKLQFGYRKTPVLEQIDLTMNFGEIVSLLGPNGSGKSTLLKLLLGHLRGRGRILWQGRRISQWAQRELARLIAYLPQNPLIDETQSVAEVLALGRAPYWGAFGLETSADAAVMTAVIEQLSIDRAMLNRRMDQLSGGQRQRIFIGRCLIQQPRVLLLDEPTNNLDLRYQMQLLNLLRDLAHEQKLAVLMSGHDINLAAEFSDRMVLLHEGKKVAEGGAREILQGEVLSKVYGVAMEVVPREGRGPLVFPACRSSTTLTAG